MGFKPIKVDRRLVYENLWFSTWNSGIEHLSKWLPMDDVENQVRFIETYAKPYFEPARHPYYVRSQYWMKESLRYCLNIYDEQMRHEFYYAWDSMHIQFDRPNDVHAFLLRVWQILFPDEPWEIDDLSFYHDISAEVRAQAQTKLKRSTQPAVDPLATPRSPRRRKRHEVVELGYLYDDPYSENYYAES